MFDGFKNYYTDYEMGEEMRTSKGTEPEVFVEVYKTKRNRSAGDHYVVGPDGCTVGVYDSEKEADWLVDALNEAFNHGIRSTRRRSTT